MGKLKLVAILMLGVLLALFQIFTPAEVELNLAIFSLFSLVVVGPPAMAIATNGLRVGTVIEPDVQVMALVMSGVDLALLQIFTIAPAEIKLGLIAIIVSLIIVPPVALGLRKALGPPTV